MISKKSLKVSFVGDSSVGKTSLINRKVKGTFDADLASTIGSSHLKTMQEVENEKVELLLWDTAGQEKYHSLVPLYTRDSDVIIICAAANDQQSITSIDKWMKIADQVPSAVPFVVINKIDLLNDNQEQFRMGLAQQYDHVYFCSALTNEGVEELFYDVAVEPQKPQKEEVQDVGVHLEADTQKGKKKSGCC